MELIDSFRQDGTPPVYHFVFKPPDERGDYPILVMPDDGRWPYARFLMGEYHPGQANEHLGRRVLQHQLGRVIVERLITRLPY